MTVTSRPAHRGELVPGAPRPERGLDGPWVMIVIGRLPDHGSTTAVRIVAGARLDPNTVVNPAAWEPIA